MIEWQGTSCWEVSSFVYHHLILLEMRFADLQNRPNEKIDLRSFIGASIIYVLIAYFDLHNITISCNHRVTLSPWPLWGDLYLECSTFLLGSKSSETPAMELPTSESTQLRCLTLGHPVCELHTFALYR